MTGEGGNSGVSDGEVTGEGGNSGVSDGEVTGEGGVSDGGRGVNRLLEN